MPPVRRKTRLFWSGFPALRCRFVEFHGCKLFDVLWHGNRPVVSWLLCPTSVLSFRRQYSRNCQPSNQQSGGAFKPVMEFLQIEGIDTADFQILQQRLLVEHEAVLCERMLNLRQIGGICKVLFQWFGDWCKH